MATKMMPSSLKPPLARSPIHLRPRPRRPLQSNPNITQTPPGSLTKTQLPKVTRENEELGLSPNYRTISCELRALAKMVHQEFSTSEWCDAELANNSLSASRSVLFERGKFYEEYSARRNERLKRKKGGETGDGKKVNYDLGVRVESAKRRGETKRFESLRKTVPCTPMMERSQASSSRYLLRSTTSKENKKLPLAFANVERTAGVGDKKIGVRRKN